MVEAGPGAPTVRQDVLDEVVALLGREPTDRLLAGLAAELGARLGAGGASLAPGPLGQDAHALVSAASMLGFAPLAELCREIERACETEDDLGGLLARLVHERRAALDAIERLRTQGPA